MNEKNPEKYKIITRDNKCFDVSFGYRQKPSQSTAVMAHEKQEKPIEKGKLNRSRYDS